MAKREFPFSSNRLDVCAKRARYAYDNVSWTRVVHELQGASYERRRKALGVFVILCLVGSGVCILFDCFLDLFPVQLTALGLLVLGLYFEVVLRVRDYGRRASEEEDASSRFLALQRDAMNVLSAVQYGGLSPEAASELVNELETNYQDAVDAANPVSPSMIRRAERAVTSGHAAPALNAGEAYLPDYLKAPDDESPLPGSKESSGTLPDPRPDARPIEVDAKPIDD